MSKIFDCFIYNNEVKLLDLRIKYLYDYVDYFVITESKQTFQGVSKEYNFEKNFDQFSKYKDKIIYFQNNLFAENVSDLKQKFKLKYPQIYENFKNLNNFDKSDFTWCLDAFHREIILESVRNEIKDDDIFILSDVDEIPNYEILKNKIFDLDKVNVLVQKEYRYYINSLIYDNWHGSILCKWNLAREIGLNKLRIASKKSYEKYNYIRDGGYHFSTQGPIENIVSKINSWGHKEFNNFLIKGITRNRLKKGLDIFFIYNNQFKVIDLNNINFFDKYISRLLLSSKLEIKKDPFIKKGIFDDIIFYVLKTLILFFKIKRKIMK